jgi:hypothetical protein
VPEACAGLNLVGLWTEGQRSLFRLTVDEASSDPGVDHVIAFCEDCRHLTVAVRAFFVCDGPESRGVCHG